MRIDDMRFLVVDDHGFQRWAMRNILMALGAKHVFLAHDGAAAIDAFRRADPPFDIVVTDLDMPGMDGMELIRQLARERSTAPLIVTSALGRGVLGTVQAMGDAYGVQVVAALEKPVTTRSLLAAIDLHAGRAAATRRSTGVTAVEIAAALHEGEIVPRFEPRVDMRSRQIVSAQAVPVWAEPSGRVTSAEAFTNVARVAGLVPRLGWCVLRQAVSACADWRREGLEIGVCVPIGTESLRDPGYALRAQGCAASVELDPGTVVLQFDAAPNGDGLGTMLENLSRLRMFGFGVALPFGRRLRHREELAHAPCNELSIDIAALRGECAEGVPGALEASVETARLLGMTIAVHGIASRAHWEFAAAFGAHVATGPCLGVPLSPAAFAHETARRPVSKAFPSTPGPAGER